MRIVLVCRAHPFLRAGGMPFVVEDRAKALAACGHEVHVLTTGGSRNDLRRVDGYHLHLLDCERMAYSRAFAAECRDACESLRPDVIHLDSFDPDHLWWTGRPGGANRTAVTMHGIGHGVGWGSLLTQWNLYLDGTGPKPEFDLRALKRHRDALAHADIAIAISRHELWIMRDTYALSKERTSLVRNPIPSYFFEGVRPPNPAGYVLCAGNRGTSGNRGFANAERAARRAKAGFHVVHDVARADMPAVYDAARALALPTYWSQGYDLTVAEALARRRPVIASHTGSYAREEIPGLVTFSRGDEDAMAALLRDPPDVPEGVVDDHRPEKHAEVWELAVLPPN